MAWASLLLDIPPKPFIYCCSTDLPHANCNMIFLQWNIKLSIFCFSLTAVVNGLLQPSWASYNYLKVLLNIFSGTILSDYNTNPPHPYSISFPPGKLLIFLPEQLKCPLLFKSSSTLEKMITLPFVPSSYFYGYQPHCNIVIFQLIYYIKSSLFQYNHVLLTFLFLCWSKLV